MPRVGLDHIAVGREQEMQALLQDLDNIAGGGSGFRFVIGRYGAGKSFTLQLIRNHAMEKALWLLMLTSLLNDGWQVLVVQALPPTGN